MGVLQGSDYLARLNAPTAWTRRATAAFRNTSRAIARVLHSTGPGAGGVVLTVRFAASRERLARTGRAAADRGERTPHRRRASLCRR